MRITQEEMDIRKQTRAVEKTKGDEEGTHAVDARRLGGRQVDLTGKVKEAAQGREQNQKLMELLQKVDKAMADATQLLNSPNTGGEAVAAETEVIELLGEAMSQASPGASSSSMMAMMQKMQQQMGMKPAPPGQNPGQAGGAYDSEAANAAMAGKASEADLGTRDTEKGSGTGLMNLPAEFREALGGYFEAVEKIRKK